MEDVRTAIVFDAARTGYSIDQVSRPMTVGELIDILDEFEDDTLVILSHDNDYTFGSLSGYPREFKTDEDGEWMGMMY